IFQTTTSIANSMILLASIDRFCSSSQSVKLRSISNMKTTRWMIFVMWQQCIFFLSFFLFIASGSIYRQEMIRLFKRMYKHDDLTQIHTHKIQPLPRGTNTRQILATAKIETFA
ncbi:unnamed protein product, partial [Rotaria sordida]